MSQKSAASPRDSVCSADAWNSPVPASLAAAVTALPVEQRVSRLESEVKALHKILTVLHRSSLKDKRPQQPFASSDSQKSASTTPDGGSRPGSSVSLAAALAASMQASSTGADLELRQVEQMFLSRLADECKERRQLRNDMMAELGQVSASASKAQVMVNRLADKLGSVQSAILEHQSSIESRVASLVSMLGDVRQTLVVMEEGVDERCTVLEQTMDERNPKRVVDERVGEIKSFIRQYFSNFEQHLGQLKSCSGGTTTTMQQQLENLQQQLDAVQAGIEERSSQGASGGTGSVVWRIQEAALKEHVESTCKRLAERMEDVQSASETRCTALHAELGDLKLQGRRSVLLPSVEQQTTAKMQTILEDRCCSLEARLKAQIEQVRCSDELSGTTVEGFGQRVAALEEKAEKRYATLEARIGSACVPELVNSTADRIHRRINTVQAMMERRCCMMESQVCALHKDISSFRLPQGDGPMPQA
mmetsp:Transcript_9215/g.17453  ORF Transcript_9215/g.17453 Transcript_9215/m.17453 type:complete len:478 (+) Transcript_9215:47-1480(+)